MLPRQHRRAGRRPAVAGIFRPGRAVCPACCRHGHFRKGGSAVILSVKPLGDAAVTVRLGDVIHPDVHRRVRGFCHHLEKNAPPGVVEWVPTYGSVTVFYQPHVIRYEELAKRLADLAADLDRVHLPPARLVVLPTVYGGEWGPDLSFVAEHNGLSPEEVIRLHSGRDYLVYMMGFVPGFPYLGGMSREIAAPRLERPRSRIPAGSVGIAGNQTGVYPLETPGGWRLIGRTPVRLYDPCREEPILLRMGDRLRFEPVGEEEYREIEERVRRGTYTLEIREYTGGEEA
ncbi:inhibitor of KinA [Planifilum fimeticola]|uniref:Inhibitor of KinA n=1 Tax=Planifilum fimeticola TaxID=201975 RepID=A0A2T0LCD0_9BACL|nr:inhibitor of KinA [Planifilum fimeticola]